ncbi:sensor domain-containing diguanylate cyclase [Actinomadura parmotrematis]|uniref:GGDEF domain-containing protein n=1 Tax=Actinomadura parmotrematis TaxID=2864039 RepID=A0ABS7FV51_9ACTN|nr:GGDEF domain-containing protein [Actinomadura parmotrematis]MBW8484201.1 GGDEF domain-containing protein [Actinomadura parmotrematis]
MTAVQSSAGDRGGELARRPPRQGVRGRPSLLGGYVPTVVAVHLALIVVALPRTAPHLDDLLTFGALLACGAVCIEASRRLGMPAGVARDLLSAWWVPVALLLPPLYALLIPIPLQVLLQFRVRRTLLYRRVLVTAALGLSGAAASVVFHSVVPESRAGAPGWVVEGWPGIPLAVACAALFAVLNTLIVAVAAHAAGPEATWRDVLWNRESLTLDVVELCVGVLVTVTSALALGMLALALPPVVLLQRSLMHQQLQAAARTDAKTGLLNAAAWQREADTELSRAQRTHDPLALLLIDIDHFKRVNDTYGHLVGDQVLVGVASTLLGQLRDYDMVGRFGGEEFVVLLPGADTVEACRVAERLRGRVRRLAVPAEDGTVGVTISVGVALFRMHGGDLIELLAAADLALYRAKQSGRDRVCLPALDDSRAPRGEGAPDA